MEFDDPDDFITRRAPRGGHDKLTLAMPCRNPEKGPMLYEARGGRSFALSVRQLAPVLEYCAELTRQTEASRRSAPSTNTLRGDQYLYPRAWEASATQEEQASEEEQLSQAQREAAWVQYVAERVHRRRRVEAGYHPDVSNGLRRLGISEDGAEELVLEQSTFPQPGDTDAPPTRRYGVAMHSAQPVAAVSAQQSESEPSPESSAPVAVPIDLLLRRVFSAGHPGVGKMRAWLAEEEIYTAGDLQSALASSCTSGQVGAGAHYLRSLGFVAAWAEALAAAVQSNAVSERE